MSECDDDTITLNQCYRCDPKVLDILNIELNSSNFVVVLWNKYQIFIYEDFKFTTVKVFTPEYQVHRLLITNNYMLCLDINGFVHVTTLKFKNPDQKLYKCVYQPREQGILACVAYSPDESLSLKYDSETYFLCLNRIDTDFKELKKVALNTKDPWPFQESARDKYFLAHRKINGLHCTLFEKMFSTEKLTSQCHFTVISFDKHTVYGCLFNPKTVEKKIDLIKLYSCPSEICSIEIVGNESTYIFIGLKMGTILRLTLNDLYTSNNIKIKPEVTYLNSALHKLKIINDTIFVYTDGATMWKADNLFSNNTTFKQFFVRNVNDFIQCGDKIICTTFTKLIYSFAIQAEESFLKPVNKNYYAADELLQNSELLHKIFQEVEKSKDIAKQLSIEGSYIAALALAQRQDIVHKVISSSVNICGSFEEVMRENAEELTLTEDISQYAEPDIYLIQVSAQISSDNNVLFDIVSDIMANSEAGLQVTLSNKHKILHTSTIQMSKTNILIPLHLEDATEIYANISLVVRVPGTYDKKQKIWTELYKNNVTLTSEQFIRVNSPKTLKYLKGMTEDFEEAIMTCSNQSRNEFEFTNTSKQPIDTYIMYVRLPRKFNFDKYFRSYKTKFMKEILNTDEFLKSQSEVNFLVGKENVAIRLENDGFSDPLLKVMSGNMQVTAGMRNFFADVVYRESPCEPGPEFINIGFYTIVENLQKAVKNCITESANFEEFAPLMEKFEKEVVAMLPV